MTSEVFVYLTHPGETSPVTTGRFELPARYRWIETVMLNMPIDLGEMEEGARGLQSIRS